MLTPNSVALSPQTNYTDWATTTCRRNLVPTFVDKEVSRGQRGGSHTVVNLSFLDRSRYFFKYLLIYPHKGWVDPVPDPLLLRKSGIAGNRTRDLCVCNQELWPLRPLRPNSDRNTKCSQSYSTQKHLKEHNKTDGNNETMIHTLLWFIHIIVNIHLMKVVLLTVPNSRRGEI
jgi:hypothetical protein